MYVISCQDDAVSRSEPILCEPHGPSPSHPDGPGLQVQFRVDDGSLKAGERRWFLGYLAQQTLQVDVWDSASLLLVGSCCVPLKVRASLGFNRL